MATSRTLCVRLIILGGIICFQPLAEAEPPAASFDIVPVPSWVKPIPADNGPAAKTNDSGISYLLVDEQMNLAQSASYYREVRKITSENGVQNGASITTSFDPSYQRLFIHTIQLTRNGVASNRLDRSQIRLLQREKDMERFVYDGSYTAQCELEDVRVGDVIEFAYTIEGENPVMNGKYSSYFRTQWSFPVRRLVLRFIYPSERKLRFLARNGKIDPKITTDRGITEWLYDESDIRAREIDADVPDDYYPRKSVQITEFGNWAEVVDWALPLFRADTQLSPELSAKVQELTAIPDLEQRVLAGLRFAQDEIRYLGIESGPGSHRPTPPGEVLRRRYGDCKDKVLLLTTLLQKSGIDAAPALVSLQYRRYVNERLPTPDVFNHVIVQVRLGNTVHWIDPTRLNQRGPLSQVYVANCGFALVLRPGVTDLTAYRPPPESFPKRKIVEKYRIPAPEKSGELEVITEYRGFSADRTRGYFSETDPDEIQKKYLQFYSRRFPQIKTKKPLGFEELSGENGCRVTESYTIPTVWTHNKEKNQYRVSLLPTELDSAMGSAPSPQRDDPLSLEPTNVIEEINAEMFEDWSATITNQDVTNEFFRYHEGGLSRGRHLQFSYSYETLVDRIPAADVPKFNDALTKIKDTLGYNLTYTTPEQLKSIRGWHGFNWPVAICLAGVLLVSSYVAYRYFHGSKLTNPLPPPLPSERPSSVSLDGIGGWLILVAIGLSVGPVRVLITSIDVATSVLNLQMWRSLTDPGETAYHAYWAPVLLFELFFNALTIVFLVLLIFLFFKKRYAWRQCYVAFLLINCLGVYLDSYFVRQIPAAVEASQSTGKEMTQAIVSVLIWVPYALVSKRVKATFRY